MTTLINAKNTPVVSKAPTLVPVMVVSLHLQFLVVLVLAAATLVPDPLARPLLKATAAHHHYPAPVVVVCRTSAMVVDNQVDTTSRVKTKRSL